MKRALLMAALLALSFFPAAAQEDPGPPADPHSHLRQILERPPYQRWRLRQERGRRERAQRERRTMGETLSEWFDAWMARRRRADRSAPPPVPGDSHVPMGRLFWAVGWVVIGVLALGLLYLIAKAFWAGRRESDHARMLSRQQIAQALEEGEALALDEQGWLKEAERLAAGGDFRVAYRAIYLALLSGLHSARLIDFRTNRTNWAYVRSFRGEEAQRETFGRLTSLFDRVWYGAAPPGAVSLEQVRASVFGLLRGGAEHG